MENRLRVVVTDYNEGYTGTPGEIEQLTALLLRMRRVVFSWEGHLKEIKDADVTVKWLTIPPPVEDVPQEEEEV